MTHLYKSLTLLLLLVFIASPISVVAKAQSHDDGLRIAKVKELTNIEVNQEGIPVEQIAQVEILNGKEKGETFFAHNLIPENKAYSIFAKEGRKYIVAIEEEGVFITDYYREGSIIWLIASFLILLIIIGRMQGFKAIVSLGLTGLAIFYVLLPAIKAGFNPILAAVIVSAFATASTMILIAGFTKKSLSATIGTTGGVAVAGLLAFIVTKLAPLSGLASSEARILLANTLANNEAHIDFQGVLAAGILISSLGAAMDVAISIASAAKEIYLTNPKQSPAALFDHAMTVGKDIMGTMTNTLILAYTGSSIPLFLLLSSNDSLRIFNMEIIATELTAAVVGSIGLLFAIPITAFISVVLLKPPPIYSKYSGSKQYPQTQKVKVK